MNVYVLSIFDKTSYQDDDRVVINGIFDSEEKAKNRAKKLSLSDFEDFDIEKWEVK